MLITLQPGSTRTRDGPGLSNQLAGPTRGSTWLVAMSTARVQGSRSMLRHSMSGTRSPHPPVSVTTVTPSAKYQVRITYSIPAPRGDVRKYADARQLSL